MAIKTFTTGEVLTASDTNTYLANSGLVYITEVALSTTAIDGIFTSTYDNYRIVVNNAQSASSNALIRFQLRDTANATLNSADYQAATTRFDSAGTTFNYGTAATTSGETGINLITTVDSPSFAMDVFGPRLTDPTSVVVAGMGAITGPSIVATACTFRLTTACAGIIFSLSAGTIASGRVFVYGYRKA